MWLFTTRGMFSVVQENGKILKVRARLRGDLEKLREVMPELGDTKETLHRDYRWRALVRRSDFAKALPTLVNELTYTNFKNAVAVRQGVERAVVYHDVWDTMWNAQENEVSREKRAEKRSRDDEETD